MTVTFSPNSSCIHFDPEDGKIVGPVEYEPTKQFDGLAENTYNVYVLMASYFGIVIRKKIGFDTDKVNNFIKFYTKEGYKMFDSLSKFLKKEIKNKVSKSLLGSIKDSNDVLKYTKDTEIIQSCIYNLERTVQTLEKQNLRYESQTELPTNIKKEDEEENRLLNEWEKECNNILCEDTKCCLNKKTLKRKSFSASMLRKGSLNYASTVQITHLPWIQQLIHILKNSLILLKEEEEV